jgi:cell division protein FtsB
MLSKSVLWIFINIILSVAVIYCGHYAWNLIKDTYSTKKTKDLVNTQIQKYKKMMAEMQESNKFLNDSEKIDLDSRLTDFMDNLAI